MKRTFVFVCILLLSVSCTKNNGSPDNTGVLSEVPIAGKSWVFTVDVSAEKYTFIRTNLDAMFRKDILKSYSLYELSKEDNVEFYVSETLTENGKKCVTIQLHKNRNRWCWAGLSTNRQEMHMGISNHQSITIAPGENYKFFLHRQPSVNGIISTVVESVAHPGYYMSSSQPGFNYAANVMTFTTAISPEKATVWQCRQAN